MRWFSLAAAILVVPGTSCSKVPNRSKGGAGNTRHPSAARNGGQGGSRAPRARPRSASNPARPAAKKAAGKWTCPMHPAVRVSVAGKCPICGMDLIRAVTARPPPGPVWTCSMHPHVRAKAPGRCPICGMDLVRMNRPVRPARVPPIPPRPKLEASWTFRACLDAVYLAYLNVHHALSRDQLAPARNGATKLAAALPGVKTGAESADVKKQWAAASARLKKLAGQVAASADLKAARRRFVDLSTALIDMVQRFGLSGSLKAFRYHCPMAPAKGGADWLQATPKVENPYHGPAMLRCGSRHKL